MDDVRPDGSPGTLDPLGDLVGERVGDGRTPERLGRIEPGGTSGYVAADGVMVDAAERGRRPE